MKTKEIVPLHITTMTPLHITSGNTLLEEKDFYVDGNTLHRIDYPHLLSNMKETDLEQSIAEMKQSGLRSLLPKPIVKKEKKAPRVEEDWKQVLRAKVGLLTQQQLEPEEEATVEENKAPLLQQAQVYDSPLEFSRAEMNGKIEEMALGHSGRSFLPGSSLKGAIRTALYFATLQKHPSRLGRLRFTWTEDPMQADYPLTREMTGAERHDSGRDIFRQLSVLDTNTVSPQGSLAVYQLKILNIGLVEDKPCILWKKGPKRNVFHYHEAESLCWEMIAPQIQFQTEIQIDTALKNFMALSCPEREKPAFALAIGHIMIALKDFGHFIVQRELAFAQQYDIPFLAEFYQDLLQKCEGAKAGKEAYIPLGAGVTWQGKTVGGLLDPSGLDTIRKHFYRTMGKFIHQPCEAIFHGLRLRKGLCPRCAKSIRADKLTCIEPFPKTRHIVFRNGQPLLPPGWVYVSL